MTAPLAAAMAAVLVTALVAHWRRRYVFIAVEGDSMVPTLANGDRLLIRRGAVGIVPGQLVVARKPDPGRRWDEAEPDRLAAPTWLVKRVAAVDDGPERLFLLGDNAAGSWDSRQWGACPTDRVLGVVVRVFPGTS